MVSLLMAAGHLIFSTVLYVGSGTADELSTRWALQRGRIEVGAVHSPTYRIGLKAAIMVPYLIATEKARKSPKKYVRVLGKVVRYGIPAMYVGGAIHSRRRGGT